MFWGTLDEITEADCVSLGQDQVPESIRLEFKRDLNLASRAEKAEAAKDVSALANTTGGRLLYGIDEQTLAGGSVVASTVVPLTDGTVDSRLEDVLVSSIHPRPRFRTRKVPVSGGFVLIVEVYPAHGGDLYMVTGFATNRFYRRGEQRTVLMTEPEIREAYFHVAASRQTLDASIEQMVRMEAALVPATNESVFVIPWFGHRTLVNPRQFGPQLGIDLANGPFQENGFRHVITRLKIGSDGYRGHGPEGAPLNECQLYASIRRNGLVHLAEHLMRGVVHEGEHPSVDVRNCLEAIIGGLTLSRYILDRTAYWGPVRVIHQLRVKSPFYIDFPGERSELTRMQFDPIPAGTYEHAFSEFSFIELGSSLKPVLLDMLDQLFQTGGRQRCPWFNEAGDLVEGMEQYCAEDLLQHLR
jgi:hypothetical protein